MSSTSTGGVRVKAVDAEEAEEGEEEEGGQGGRWPEEGAAGRKSPMPYLQRLLAWYTGFMWELAVLKPKVAAGRKPFITPKQCNIPFIIRR